MSYKVGEQKDGGFIYRVEVNGLVMTGWRRGTRAQVEEYARQSARMCVLRASGLGFIKIKNDGRDGASYLLGAKKSAEVRRK